MRARLAPAAPRPGDLRVAAELLGLLRPYLGRVALSVLLGVLTVASSVALLTLSAWLISKAALRPSIAALSVAIVGVRFFGLTRGIFRYLERLVSHGVTFRLLARLRVWFYQRVEPRAPAVFLLYPSGDLLARIQADVETLQQFYVRAVAPAAVALIAGLGMALFLGAFDPSLAAVFAVAMLLGGLLLPLLVRSKARSPAREAVAQQAELKARLVEMTQGLADLLAAGGEGAALAAAADVNRRLGQEQRRLARIGAGQQGLGVLLAGGAMWAVLVAALALVERGALEPIHLAGLALGTMAVFEAFAPLAAAAQQLDGALAAGARLIELAEWPTPVEDPSHPAPLPSAPDLRVEGVRARYGASEPWAVDGVSFDLPAGKWLAIVGPSGSGKSTVARLLLRFWEHQEGQVWLGGRPLRDYDQEEVRSLFRVVPEKSHCFNDTIANNIRLARPAAVPAEVATAAAAARLDGFIDSLPEGYETRAGEHGRQLSGGQRQRLALARAHLHGGSIWLLDEPTAGLDPQTEGEVLEAVFAAAEGVSLILITHRPAGLEEMDEILVLDEGRVVERGSHAELIGRQGQYARLWSLAQAGEDDQFQASRPRIAQ